MGAEIDLSLCYLLLTSTPELTNQQRMQNRMDDIVEIRTEKQISALADLAAEIWMDHYVPIVGKEQVVYMLKHFQSKEAITEQLSRGYEYFSIFHNDELKGYMALLADKNCSSILISKLYVKKSARGYGLGKKMLCFVVGLCRRRRIKSIWLTVNKNNHTALKWYSHAGFRITEEIVQDIGGGFVMDDFRLEKSVDNQVSSENPSIAS